MDVKIEESWRNLLKEEFNKEYFVLLTDFIREEYKSNIIYPPARLIFNAFNLCPVDKVKVVIIGQDPYHGPNQACGLSFSVNNGVTLPPSLKNIYKELKADLGIDRGNNGDLTNWAKQGVLMLNATLTVKKGQPASHQKHGWEIFTDRVIELLSENSTDLIFVLWGAYAQAKAKLIDTSKHIIIESAHPSPFSADRGFFGSRPFSKINQYLTDKQKSPINWS
jgi:uracil-DNA glycosylase